MIITLPYPQDRYDGSTLRRAMDVLQRAFQRVASSEQGVPSILLVSPGGKVWRVTVDDAGALATTQLPLGQPVT